MSRCDECGSRGLCPDWCGADPYYLYEERENLQSEVEELEERIEKAIKMVHNIRSYSEVYTPIREGCEEVLRVLKGRDET